MSLNKIIKDSGFYIDTVTMDEAMRVAHRHDAYEIYYLIEGSRVFFIDKSFFRVKEGDFILVPKGVFHRTTGGAYTRTVINFSTSYLQEFCTPKSMSILLKAFERYQVHPEEKSRERALNILLEMQELFFKQEDRIFILLTELLDILTQSTTIDRTMLSEREEKISDIIEYTNKNYMDITSIQDISNTFYLSKEYFCRLFKKHMGITFSDYLNKIKLQHAANFLITTEKQLPEIATMCGFHSSSYFCKAFKKEYGITPNTYKYLHKKN